MASKRVTALAIRQLRTCASISAQSLRPSPRALSQPARRVTLSIRPLSTSTNLRKEAPPEHSSGIPPSTLYTFEDIQSIAGSLTSTPSPKRLLIDVREPSELIASGTIPTSINIPISSAPDAFFLPPAEFEDKFGFERPGKETEVIFFCKAGVRSRQAARLAGQAEFGGKIGEFPGSWNEWAGRGGKVESVK